MEKTSNIVSILAGSLVVLVLIVSVYARDYDYDEYQDPYNTVVPVKEVLDYHAKPKYAFGYEVEDYYNQLSHGRWEIRDGDVTQGQYRVLLPDGRIQIVSYIADKDGYRPNIQYTKQGVHPPPPPEYAQVKVPKYILSEEAESPVHKDIVSPSIHTPAPIVSAAFGLNGSTVQQGPVKITFNPEKLSYTATSLIPQLTGKHYENRDYGRDYAHGYSNRDYFKLAYASKVSKKRALLYGTTLFRKDVE